MLSQSVREFIEQFYAEEGGDRQALSLSERLAQIEVAQIESFTPTTAELAFAGRVAWRNSVRCIGRLFWPALQVRDLRHLETLDEVFDALVAHLQDAFCGGHIQPIMTALPQGVRVVNSQLIRYAGYVQADNPALQSPVLGDPDNVQLTQLALSLGWQAPTPLGAFDVLPLIVQRGDTVKLYPLPPEAVHEVPLIHPDHPAINALGLRWYAVPAISDAQLHLAHLRLPVVFNGWYMQTEIAARDLADEGRYNALPRVAQALGLDTRLERTLWRDRALLELNVAALYSFHQAGVKIVDHHTAAAQFERFQQQEGQAGREVRGRWSWLIAPMSPATSPVWGQRFVGQELSPNFSRPPQDWPLKRGCPVHSKA